MTDSQSILDYQTLPPRRPRKRILTKKVVGVLLVVFGMGFLLLVLALNQFKEKMNRDGCSYTLRCIGQAVQLYAADQKTLPDSFLDLTNMCDLSPEVYICPNSHDVAASVSSLSDITQKPGHCSYVYAAKGQSTPWMKNPAGVLAYENPNNHSKGGHVLYADGRVDWLASPELSTLISELEAGFNPPRGKGNPPATGPAENH